MTKTTILVLVGLGLLGLAQPARAQGTASNQEFLGVDLDNGGVYYNGYNSGRYCLYRTVDVYNRYTGYVEARRVRRCGRGLYLP
ncbi:hypothetical protein [Methylobacterium brachythecii]|uniref:Uncharacterized protein n=1 Tax=Methylobacterium brachythecii TaxID=1176177 RepID=A0A7W6AGS9_9HYPH|nr:hypothetical protein [Methylobacterium brachythecii]MBB3900959.1 hypothetical protein [Methylobacterium brachythecii]GLS45260.1 hypothetical protein GCM10007884_32490 [Methylobacterium brachythecii]